MKEIFEQYGGVIVTVVAVMALIAVIRVLMADGGIIADAFETIITNFLSTTTM